MAVVKGMLMQSEGQKGVVMTPDGEFINVVLPNNKHVKLGEEIEAVKCQQSKSYKYLLVVAAVFLMVLLIPGYQHFYTNEAMAYVALDINPSIELAVDKDIKISAVQGLNSDGEKIASEVNVIGMQLYQAMPLLVEQAITDGYLEPGRDNIVLSTVTINENKETIKIEETKLQQAINKPIQDQQIAARVVVKHSDTLDRDEAKKAGLSTGKYLIYKQAQKQGVNVTVEEIRTQGIYQLEQQILKKHLIPENIDEAKQQLSNTLEQQVPDDQREELELQQTLNKAIEQLPPGQRKKIIESPITEHKPREIDVDHNNNQKHYVEKSGQWMPSGLEKKLEQKQKNDNKDKD